MTNSIKTNKDAARFIQLAKCYFHRNVNNDNPVVVAKYLDYLDDVTEYLVPGMRINDFVDEILNHEGTI